MEEKVRELFEQAVMLAPEEREAFLDQACGDDAKTREGVEVMLRDFEQAGSFFGNDDETKKLTGIPSPAEPDLEKEGDEIGSYILRQKIGEGGFGSVWMAEQTGAISRMVALKVVKAGMDTSQVLARFEAERQALAMMDHPHIAKILDAGATPTGRPYFAMELVRGIPITDFCREQKLGPRRRLTLFQDVCSAINHAHQKGIIHRDLKPSNVMVTLEADKPVVKVIDFGIAKATQNKLTDKTLFTRFEQFMGTPVYMSPEQAAMSNLDIDTRSDIYSLGVLLYEMLAGSPPFDQKSLLSAGYDEMRRIIKEDEPPKPSVRLTQTQASEAKPEAKAPQIEASMLKGELDWIVMKAIEKDRTRRYETANAFAADIGRYLGNEPVLAAAPSTSYRFRKFARRNTVTLGVALGFVLILVGTTVLNAWLTGQANEAREKSDSAKDLIQTALLESDEARKEAENAYVFLLRSFKDAGLSLNEEGREITMIEVLDSAREKLETEFAGDPEQLGELQWNLARAFASLGKNDEAIALYEKIRDHYRSDPAHRNALGAMWALAGRYSDAGQKLSTIDEAYSLALEAYGERDPLTLSLRSARIMRRNAADQAEGMEEEAESLLALSREVHGDDSPEVVDALHMLAHVSPPELRLQRHEEAVTHALESLGEAQTETLSAMRCLATMYGSKNPNRLVELREKVVAGYDALNEAGATPQTLGYLLELVKAYETAGYWEKARTAAEKLVTLSRKRLGPDHPRTTQAESKLEELMPRDLRVPLSEEVRQLSAFTPTDATSALKNLMYAGIVAYHENRVEHEALTEMIISQMRVEEEKMNLMMMAKTIHLMPPSANGPTSAHREAQVLQEAASESLELDHFLLLDLALGACRVEDWDRLELLLKDGSTPLNRPGFRVSGHSLRAISSWQKGQRALALQELNLAKRFYEADSRTGKGHPFDVVLYPHLILREALELIEGNRDWLPPLQTLEDQQIPATIVPPNSVWRWLHPLDGVDPAKKDPDFHETFAEKDFDDSFWKAGQDSAEPGGGFGYGDDWFTGVDIGLPMVENATYGLDGKAAYFRLKFKTEREFRNLELRCQRDDGIIVYLNGKEVARDNMQAGEARYDIPAVEKVAHDKPIKEQVTYRIPLPGAILRPGEHVLAISVHNTEGGSSDLRIGGISLVEVVESHRENIPPRPEDRDRKEIDLSEHYTVSLASKLWSLKHPGHDLSRLAQTFTPRHGVTFDLRGAIWLESGKTASGLTAGEFGGLTLKTSVEGIVVNEVTPRIHFLAGAQWVTTIGERLARFVIHYENGSTTEMPVVLGPDGVVGLRMVAFETVVGWKGSISENETQGVLSELIWDNPHPDKIITTIDFVSELSPRGAPFLVAITLE